MLTTKAGYEYLITDWQKLKIDAKRIHASPAFDLIFLPSDVSLNSNTPATLEKLIAYKISVPVYDYTVIFCKRCSSPQYIQFPQLSSHRTYDQMVQASRSGNTNIPEGNQQASLEGYIKLTGVSAASLEKLLKDYLTYARQNRIPVWSKEEAVGKVREVSLVWEIIKATPTLPNNPYFPDLPNDVIAAVNMMITLVNQVIYFQKKLKKSLEEKFVEKGGFRENLFKKRVAKLSGR